MKSVKTLMQTIQYGLLSRILIVISLIAVPLPLPAIGLKVVADYPQTLLATAKTWDIDMYDDDWIFFATQDGLIQYDGGTIRLFMPNNRYSLRSVTVDRPNDRVLVGGISEFGYFSPSPVSSLEYVCLSDSWKRRVRLTPSGTRD